MEQQDQLKLNNEVKLKINSTLAFFHSFLNHWDMVSTETMGKINAEMFISEHFRLITEYEDMRKSGTEPERAKFILLSQLKKNIVESLNGTIQHGPNDFNGIDTKEIN